MNMLLSLLLSLIVVLGTPTFSQSLSCCMPYDAYEDKILQSFTPDSHFVEQTEADKALRAKMKSLFFEADVKDAAEAQKRVREKLVKNYNGKEVSLTTKDGNRVAGIFIERPNAQVNIVYVTGYFHDLTPPKEWCAPFAEIFPKYNIFMFDWRGFGQSEGNNALLEKCDFGPNAYPDVWAAVDFVRSQNDKPVVLHGFCFGGAMALHATLKAQEEGRRLADGLGLSCMFTRFENLFNRAAGAEDRWFFWFLLKSGLAPAMLEYMANGDLFSILPVEIVKKIDVPCWFDHPTPDRFAIMSEAVQVFNAAPGPKVFVQSELGRHVRMHADVPYQYSNAYQRFLEKHVIKEVAAN